jgi:hypothetical protein
MSDIACDLSSLKCAYPSDKNEIKIVNQVVNQQNFPGDIQAPSRL